MTKKIKTGKTGSVRRGEIERVGRENEWMSAAGPKERTYKELRHASSRITNS